MSRSHPMLFTDEMIRAILDGRKTRTMRPVTPHTSVLGIEPQREAWKGLDFARARPNRGLLGPDTHYLSVPVRDDQDGVEYRVRPRVNAGDLLWVRECWGEDQWGALRYRADCSLQRGVWCDSRDIPAMVSRWRPSIHMPRSACRIELPVVHVFRQQLGDVAVDQAQSEGFDDDDHLRAAVTEMYPNIGCASWCWVYEWEEVRRV